MNFVQQLEEYLRDLAAEARKKHPGVKEASERATLKLRSLQSNYVAAVRMASSSSGASSSSTTPKHHPTTSMFRSSEILHPFLLAANYPNADYKLLEISFKAMRLLMEADAIIPTDGIHMVRVYQIQAQVITAYFSKYYAKEIASQQQQIEASVDEEAESSDHSEIGSNRSGGEFSNNSAQHHQNEQEDSEQNDDYDDSDSHEANNNSSVGYSWFSWGTSTSTSMMKEQNNRPSGSGSYDDTSSSARSTSSATSRTMKTLKNAVSSSSGQSGNQASMSSLPHMERLALEILSSLLQLVQLLRNYPSSFTDEIWTNSVAVPCLWCSLLPPYVYASRTSTASQSNTVQQAAHSTIHQLISFLYETNTSPTSTTSTGRDNNNNNNNNATTIIHHKFIQRTWDDLLILTASNRLDSSGTVKLSGAFQLCKKRIKSTTNQRVTTNTGSALPPSPELALELMTQVWKDSSFLIKNNSLDPKAYEELLLMTMGVTMALLQQIPRQQTSVEKSLRTIQWTAALLQSHARQYPNECRELLMYMINKQLPLATTSCRKHHDFEDGYVYTYDEAVQIKSDCRSSMSAPNSGGAFHNETMMSVSSTKDSFTKQRNTQPHSSCFPIQLLWKTGFLLELLYHIMNKENLSVLDDSELSLLFVMDDEEVEMMSIQRKKTLQSLTEALSDFATVGSSCRDHVVQVVEFCYTRSNSSFKPKMFRSAENIITSGNSTLFVSGTRTEINNGRGGHDLVRGAHVKKFTESNATCPILGESIWMALQITLRIVQCLQHNLQTIDQPMELLDYIFPSSLAVFQHFMKRFIACEELIRLTLKGYSALANVCLNIIAKDSNQSNTLVQRCVLLSSLSKLSLPSWGKFDASSQLQDHHVLCLLSLLRIIHSHCDQIGTEYEIVLKTFEELSTLSIASRYLSDEIYHSSLALAAALSRFAGLSTCLSSDSLKLFTEALTRICDTVLQDRDVVGDSETVLPERPSQRPQHQSLTDTTEKNSILHEGRDSSTLGGKIMSIGVRAIYGSSNNDSNGDEHDRLNDIPKAERTKNIYYQDYRDDFIRRISVSNVNVRIHSFGRIPFCLILLADVVMANIFRQDEFGPFFASEFFKLSASRPIVRPFVMDIMTIQIMTLLNLDEKSVFEYPGKLVFEDPMQSQLLAVEPDKKLGAARHTSFLSQAQVLGSLCDAIKSTANPGVAYSALGVLNAVLEGTGENLKGEVWSLVIDSISSLSGGSLDHPDRTSSEWASCCLLAFKSLKLIVDEFLDSLPSSTNTQVRTHVSLLECCSSFVISQHDINTSLTAIGLLWTIADKDTESSSVDRALSKLVELSSDDRTEVRNAAVNTLFSCIAGRGSGFSPTFWKTCITDTILKVYAIVTEQSRLGLVQQSVKGATSRYKVAFHHSRDSAGKQWVVTQVLVLRGLTRVLRNFFALLLDSVAMDQEDGDDHDLWLQDAWVRILDYAFDAAGQPGGRDNLDIRSIGVELLVVCCQLASKAGIQAAVSPAKVSTKMEVVNGALRNVREIEHRKLTPERSYSSSGEVLRGKLFMEAFESLEFFDDDILSKRVNPDDVDLQVLHKHCSNLAKLYDCCKENEFVTDNAARSLRLFNATKHDEEEELRQDFEGRFVLLIDSLLRISSYDPKIRFMNQCQRCAIDSLQLMAAAGSVAAFSRLVSMAGVSFFVRREVDDADASTTEHDSHDSPSLISFEIASTVSREIQSVFVLEECKLLILHKVMQNFLDELGVHQQLRRRRYYKIFVPIVENGLQSVQRHWETESDITPDIQKVVDMVWEKFFLCLKEMLTPIPVSKDMKKIPRVPEMLVIISYAVSALMPSDQDHHQRTSLSSVLAAGAMHCLDVAQQHAIRAKSENNAPNSEIGRKSKRHRDELLKLFEACFSGSCSLNPDDPILRSCAAVALHGAASHIDDSLTSSDEDEARNKVSVEACILICRTLRENNTKVEAIILSTFSEFCNLIAIPLVASSSLLSGNDNNNHSNNSSSMSLVKKELGEAILKVFAEVNVAGVLDRARERYENAERNARDAMDRVVSLEAAVQGLQQEKDMLQRRSINTLR